MMVIVLVVDTKGDSAGDTCVRGANSLVNIAMVINPSIFGVLGVLVGPGLPHLRRQNSSAPFPVFRLPRDL